MVSFESGEKVKSSHSIPYTTSALVESADRRVVDLSSLGFEEMPVLGMNRTSCATEGSIFHRHRRCMEITLCVRGCAKFDCDGKVYTLKPGMVFTSLPEDIHRLRMNQRGARLYWLFFRFPERGDSVFGLTSEETAYLIRELRRLPRKAFTVSDGVRMAFEELFAAYDMPRKYRYGRSFQIRVAALKLLSAIVKDGQRDVEGGMDRVFRVIIDQMRRNPENLYDESWLVGETHLSPNTILSRFRQFMSIFDVVPPAFRASAIGFTNVLAGTIGALSPVILGALSQKRGVRGLETGFSFLGLALLLAAGLMSVSLFFTFRKDHNREIANA